MATRTKTVRIPLRFGNVADIASNTKTSLGTVTIDTPENSGTNPINFVSAMFFYTFQNTTTAADITTFTSFITLSGSTETSFTISGSLLDSGEEMTGVIGPIDYTSYFNTNYGTGTTKNISLSVTMVLAQGLGRGVYTYMELTYEYIETASSLAQTICIPYEFQGNLQSTATTVTTLEQLTGTGGLFENYSDLSIKSRWIQLKGNSNASTTATDITLSYSFDGGATSTLPTKEQGGGSDSFVEYQIDITGLTTNATHTFQLWANLTPRFSNIIISEWVTFTYTTSGTTQAVNYFEFPIQIMYPISTDQTKFSRYSREIVIPETNVSMKNCAVEITYTTNASATLGVRVGSQSFTSYAQTTSLVTGCMGLQHRFDSGSAAGAGLTLQGSYNTINVDVYDITGLFTNVTGIVKLLYLSDVAPSGMASHSRTISKINANMDFNAVLSGTDVNNFSFLTNDVNYWVHGVGYQGLIWVQANTTLFQNIQVQSFSAETNGSQYYPYIYSDYYEGDNEINFTYLNADMYQYVKLYPQSPQNLMDLTVSRNFDYVTTTANRQGSKLTLSYSNVIWTVTGTTAGFPTGDINLNLYYQTENGDYELHQTQQLTGNSSFSFTVYNSVTQYQVVANYSSIFNINTYQGVSEIGYPGDNFSIDITPPETPEYGYAFG